MIHLRDSTVTWANCSFLELESITNSLLTPSLAKVCAHSSAADSRSSFASVGCGIHYVVIWLLIASDPYDKMSGQRISPSIARSSTVNDVTYASRGTFKCLIATTI
jgi:hypothetical protein